MSCSSRTTTATPSWSVSCWPRSTRTSTLVVVESVDEVLRSGRAGALRLRPARPEPARHHRSGRAARILRADSGAAVCVLTGLDDEHLGIAAVAAGAQDYLVKGKADGEVLVRAIRYAVERRRAEASLLRLREEQLVAAESSRLERGLLPSPLLAGSPVRAHTFYRSGRTRAVIGGDFFDAVLGPSGTVHAIVGDVCGHGPDEAALGALLRVSWRALVLAGVDEPQLLPKLQQVLVSERHERSLFTTAATVALRPADDGSAGLRALVRLAGHPPPLVLGDAPHSVAPPVGLPLGIRRNASWAAVEIALEPGWAMLLHTDGLIEGRGADPDELLWTEGLIDVLAAERTPRPGPAARTAGRARGAAQRGSAGGRRRDPAAVARRRTVGRRSGRAWRWPRGSAHDGDRPRLDPALDGSDARRPDPSRAQPGAARRNGTTPASPCAGCSPPAPA